VARPTSYLIFKNQGIHQGSMRFFPMAPLNNLELALRVWIMPEDKAQANSKTEHTRQYVSILIWFATQYSGIRRPLKANSRIL
jgi:hypothetical protein